MEDQAQVFGKNMANLKTSIDELDLDDDFKPESDLLGGAGAGVGMSVNDTLGGIPAI